MMAVLGVSLVSAAETVWVKSRSYELSLSSSDNGPSSFYYARGLDTRNPWILLCKNVEECVRNVNLKEGENTLQIKIVDAEGVSDIYSKQISVDSKRPVITKTLPVKGFMSKGLVDFNVAFTEENPKSVILHYGNNIEGFKETSLVLSSCTSEGSKYSCMKQVDLSAFDGKEVAYWFAVEDEAGNIAGSQSASAKVSYLSVDATDPIIEDYSYSLVGRSLNIAFEITESNFKKVSYKDDADRVPRFRNLCSHLVTGRCTASIVLPRGEHSISFEVEDKAGNVVQADPWDEVIS